MRSRTREILDIIDKALVMDDATGQELWNILTALRGPDSGDYRRKQKVTVPIRRKAFPLTAARARYVNGADFGHEDAEYVDQYEAFSANDHFDIHGNNAWTDLVS